MTSSPGAFPATLSSIGLPAGFGGDASIVTVTSTSTQAQESKATSSVVAEYSTAAGLPSARTNGHQLDAFGDGDVSRHQSLLNDHHASSLMGRSSVPPTTPASRIISEHQHGIVSTPDTLPPSEAFFNHPSDYGIHDAVMNDINGNPLYSPDPQQASQQHGSHGFEVHDTVTPKAIQPELPTIPATESRISAYARLDFASFTFYVQTLQVVMGRRVESPGNGSKNGSAFGTPADKPGSRSRTPSKSNASESASKPTGGNGTIDVHLGTAKAISRRHAKIFYNFANQRFEFSVLGRNGAFVDDVFVEKGATVQLNHGSRVQIGQIGFTFLLPSSANLTSGDTTPTQTMRPADAISMRDGSSIQSLSIGSTPAPESQLPPVKEEIPLEQPAEKNEYDHLFIEPDGEDMAIAASILEHNKQHGEQTMESHASEFSLLDLAGKTLEQIPDIIAKEVAAMPHSVSASPVPESKPTGITTPRPKKRQEKRHPTPPSPSQIPPEYREKPPNSYSSLIEVSLRTFATERGMSLSDIYQAIQELFPYYRYAPYGWQNSVRHNLSLNKLFVKIAKEGKGWLWGLDEELFKEKEAKKNRPLARERREQERREKREREKKEKEERERKQKEEKERIEKERKEKERLEKERKEKEQAEKRKSLAALAAAAAASKPPVATPAKSATPRTTKPKVLGVAPSISKTQGKNPTFSKEALNALKALQQTILTAQKQADSKNSQSPTPGPGTPSEQPHTPLPSSTALNSLGRTSSPAPITPVARSGQQANAQAAALAKAIVASLAKKINTPSAAGGAKPTKPTAAPGTGTVTTKSASIAVSTTAALTAPATALLPVPTAPATALTAVPATPVALAAPSKVAVSPSSAFSKPLLSANLSGVVATPTAKPVLNTAAVKAALAAAAAAQKAKSATTSTVNGENNGA
ncbi:hypothetical protein V1514DRAFT_352519 [Lipomyces japonicus]|uniref:uncharacterized protein n=1 Tax=Lipomyces japonicus TaxID=56871 RepID=UPI0034CFC34C